MESENGTADTKISDSGYSNSNSNSQRSASSKSRHSGSNSSRSSGYCGTTHPDGSDTGPQVTKRNKDKDHKKKKLKSTCGNYDAIFEGNTFITRQNEEVSTEFSIEEQFTGMENIIPTNESIKPVDKPELVSDGTAAASNSTSDSNEDETFEKNDQNGSEEKNSQKGEEKEIIIELGETESDMIPPTDKSYEFQPENGFCCVISINDGVVLYTTPSLTSVLGFPKDMWLGRSFIDFVHPKDRETFSSQVTMGIALPLVNSEDAKNCLHVCLRKYRGLKSSGFGVVEKSVSYQAFQLTVTFKRVMDAADIRLKDNNSNMFLVVVAVPVCSAYTTPDERKKFTKFGMKHTSTCVFSHVDQDVVTNFGFLPQDMVGKSVFDFYHPEDMPFLKEVYESVMRMSHLAGSVFRSKPYRFAVQNGGFALIETKWSSFVNPWSKRLEFVIGLHKILQGPQNPEVFDLPKDHHQISDEVLKNAKIIKGEILKLLNKEIVRPKDLDKLEVSKRCMDLANFMDCLMTEVTNCNLQLEVPHDTDLTVSERDSVMLGEISPHHDYEDSKSSSETPPSYNQLNYNENIERFFQSKPKTTPSDGSDDRHSPMGNHLEADLEGKSSYVNDTSHNQKCLSPIQNSGTSGSGSAGMLSSDCSNPLLESRTPTANSNYSYKPPPLTEAILLKHNEDMEKTMIKRHKEYRSTIKENKKHHSKEKMDKLLHKNDKVNLEDKDNAHNHNQGVKRAGSHSWEGDNHKVSKHQHQMCPINNNITPESSSNNSPPKNTTIPPQNVPVISLNGNYQQPVMNDVNLWPPFSVTVTPINNTNCNIATTAGGTGFNSGMFPVYYLPTQRTMPDYFNSSNPTRYQVHYMPGIMHNYNAIYPDPPQIMCFPVPLVPHPVHPSITPMPQDAHQSNGLHMNNPTLQPRNPDLKSSPSVAITNAQFQRPASTATSVKAEPGSALGSIASARVTNKALSECSRKVLGLPSVCSPSSPLVSPPPGDGDMENYNMNVKGKNAMKIQERDYRDSTTMDEGSSYYSSSYSSFFKTDTGSGSNDDSNTMDLKNLTSDDNSWRRNKNFPIRKREPPWLKGVSVTPELVYRYQMAVKDMEDILEADLKALNEMNQPEAANNQLDQLYLEMELGRCSKQISLEEGGLTSSSSSDEPSFSTVSRVVKKKKSYSSLVMVYEENAPLPSPDK